MRKEKIVIDYMKAKLDVFLLIDEGGQGDYYTPNVDPSFEILKIMWKGVDITDLCVQTDIYEHAFDEAYEFMKTEY